MNDKTKATAETILTDKAELIAAIRAALTGKAKAAGESSEAGGQVAQAIRAYANATHNDGDDADEARDALTAMLNVGKIKAGTVKASGNHFAGFRAMLDAGLNIDTGKDGKPYATADAQAFIASDDVKQMKAVKELIAEMVKKEGSKWDGETDNGPRIGRLEELAESMGCDLTAYHAEWNADNGEAADADDGQALAANG